jgi:putative SOS response-associated peptidase YedK
MCGRFSLTITVEALATRFAVAGEVPAWEPRFNLAPSQAAAVVTAAAASEPRQLRLMRWGLCPAWARARLDGKALINIRAESLRDKPAFRTLLAGGRCLVPADGFYEWPRDSAGRRAGPPVRFVAQDGQPFAFAGLWDVETDAAGNAAPAFAIVTAAANATVRTVHDRMPLILARTAEPLWLDPAAAANPAALLARLAPLPAEALRAYRVSTAVNSPANDSPACIRPLDAAPPAQPT